MSDSVAADRPIRLDDSDAVTDLVAAEPLVLVEFYTNGCGKCAALEPVLGNLARVADATVAMVNAREALDLVEEHDFRGVPTLLLYRDGEVVEQRFGFQDTQTLVDFVESHAA